MSPHQTRNTGAVAIQSMVPIQSAICLMRGASRITTTEYCCRSDFAGADCAAASSASSRLSGTGRSVYRLTTRRSSRGAMASGTSTPGMSMPNRAFSNACPSGLA